MRRYIAPPLFVRVFAFLVRRVLRSLTYRFVPPTWRYPTAVRMAYQRIAPPMLHEDAGKQESTVVGHSGRLKLAVGFQEYSGDPDWNHAFDDVEQLVSLHRWGWLIFSLCEAGGGMSAERGIALMRSWLRSVPPVPDGPAGEAYTTGERIVNALLFLASRRTAVPEDLRNALLEMACYVARNIEYSGPQTTGNHICNNARALYFAGQTFGVRSFSDLAREILADALPWLVTRDGFLREESSHYHLLFTRWLLELHALATETHDGVMRAFLDPWVDQVVQRCWFFLVPSEPSGWQIPLVGDVSPDCTPTWLLDYLLPSIMPSKPDASTGMQAFLRSGWFRYDDGGATIFWHVPQPGMIDQAGHGHADLGSFVVFVDKKLVIADPGRPTYQISDSRYTYSGSAESHNTITIDGLSLQAHDRGRWFSPRYVRWNTTIDWGRDSEGFRFILAHAGFQHAGNHQKIGDRIDYVRTFRTRRGQIDIEDVLEGTRVHDILTFFHMAPHARVELVRAPRSSTLTEEQRWISPAYGVQEPSQSFVVRQHVTLPITNQYTLQWVTSRVLPKG